MQKQEQDFFEEYGYKTTKQYQGLNPTQKEFMSEYDKLVDLSYQSIHFFGDEMNQIESHNAQLEYRKQYIKVKNFTLSQEDAIGILKLKSYDNGMVELSALDGADCYKYFNRATQHNPEVALVALQQSEKNIRNLPKELVLQCKTLTPIEGLSEMVYAKKNNLEPAECIDRKIDSKVFADSLVFKKDKTKSKVNLVQ